MAQRAAIAGAVTCAGSIGFVGCGERVEAPESVRATRIVNARGDRIVTYQAYYADGVVTFLDFEPFGDPDLVSWEREGAPRRFVRNGFEPRALPADGPEPEPLGAPEIAAFEVVAAGVDVSVIPWSAYGHGLGVGAPDSVGAPGALPGGP